MTQKRDRENNKAVKPKAWMMSVCLLVPVALLLAFALHWDFYYDLNDDAAMANILSGAYTGTPALRNIQSYFPLTAVLGGLKRLIGGVEWYGVFLIAVQFGCLALVLHRILRKNTILLPGSAVRGSFASEGGSPGGAAAQSGGAVSGGSCGRGIAGSAAGRSAFLCILAVLGYLALLLPHLVFVQYSVTVGILGATAAFLFLTMEPRAAVKGWIREILPQLLLIWLGFLLRSEMLLFVSPLIALAFLIRWADLQLPSAGAGDNHEQSAVSAARKAAGQQEGKKLRRGGQRVLKWKMALLTLALVLLGKLPEYEGNEDFYASIGLDEAEADLIINYNFGIDDNIDADVLQQIADYADAKAAAEQTTKERLSSALWDYRHAEDEPYTTIAAVLYILAILAAAAGWLGGIFLRKRAHGEGSTRAENDCAGAFASDTRHLLLRLAELVVLFAGRSALLLYLYYNQRPVERLTHSLYLIEAVILVWMILNEAGRLQTAGTAAAVSKSSFSDAGAQEGSGGTDGPAETAPADARGSLSRLYIAFPAALIVLFLWAAAVQYTQIQAEYAAREEMGQDWLAFLNYCEDHPEKVYFTDVYSTVSFSEKIFADTPAAVNYDLLGGWMSGSPLELQKLAALGLAEDAASGEDEEEDLTTGQIIETSLLENENCYYAARSDYDTDWLMNYYTSKNIAVQVTPVDTIGDYWTIYQVREEQ